MKKTVISKVREIVFFILIIASVFLLFGCMTAPETDSALDNGKKIELLTSVGPGRMPGKMQYEIENESFPIGEASIKLSYGFWYDASEAKDVEYYEIRIYSGGLFLYEAEVIKTVEFNEGPYSKESFMYDKNSNGNLPLTETLELSEELFLEERGFIRIVIYGITEDTEGELMELSPVVNVYYKKHGENLELSKEYFDFDTPLWIDEVGSKERESAIEECENEYSIKENSMYSIFRKYPIDCFAVEAVDNLEDFAENDQYVMHGEILNVAVGSSVGKNKIRISSYSMVSGSSKESKFLGAYTLNYSGDYSIEIARGDSSLSVIYVYLWDDNTVISFERPSYNGDKCYMGISELAKISDVPENEIMRKEIESANLEALSFSGYEVYPKAEDGEYIELIMKDPTDTEYAIYDDKAYAWEHFGDAVVYWIKSAISAVGEFFGKIFGGN